MVCYADAVVMYHGVLFWASGCESRCAMLSKGLWIMVSYEVPVVMNRGVLLCIMVCYAAPVIVNHGVLFWASDCESCVIVSQPVIVIHS